MMGVQVRVYRGFPVTCNHSRVHGRSSHGGLSAAAKIDSRPWAFHPCRRSRIRYALCFYPNSPGILYKFKLLTNYLVECVVSWNDSDLLFDSHHNICFPCWFNFDFFIIAVEVGKRCARMLLHFLPPFHKILRKYYLTHNSFALNI